MTAIYIFEEVCAIERSSDAMEDHFIKTPPKRLICRSYVHSYVCQQPWLMLGLLGC